MFFFFSLKWNTSYKILLNIFVLLYFQFYKEMLSNCGLNYWTCVIDMFESLTYVKQEYLLDLKLLFSFIMISSPAVLDKILDLLEL